MNVMTLPQNVNSSQVLYRKKRVDGVDIFYREAGKHDAPVLILLHGFPTSSHMFRGVIPLLADRFRVIAPDYPGFGYSDMPDRSTFNYTFENYAAVIGKLATELGLERYALYVMDYGAPVGFRMATAHPERVTAFIVQNGNAYVEGFGSPFWDPIMTYWETGAAKEREAIRWLTTMKATRWQYTNGVADESLVSPDTWTLDQALLERPGNAEIQLDLFYDYRTNVPLYPGWHKYFRDWQPPMLVTWGAKDDIFVARGAAPYSRDLREAEIHMLDTGHFALEECGAQIAALMGDFLSRKINHR